MTSSMVPTLKDLYVVDTHTLIWYLTGDKKLSQRALDIFRAAERGETRLLLPAIVMAELYYANAKNHWFPDYKSLYKDILTRKLFKFLPFDHHHVLEFDRDSSVPEMHDRIIAGVARRLGAPLLTADPVITKAQIVAVEW